MAIMQAVTGSTVVTFGRHSGKTFAQMLTQEMDYCKWAVRQVSTSASSSGAGGGALGAFGQWLLSQGVEPKAQPKPVACGIVGNIPPDAYRIYTDGSCPGNGTKDQQAAGWGVVIYGGSFVSGTPLELFGPVILDRKSTLWLGATVASNNTGELSAIGEAMHWLLYEDSGPKDRPTVVMYDSDYAANIAQGKYVAKKNQELAARIQKLVGEVAKSRPLEFRHVKGHSSDPGNDRADALAKDGVNGSWGSSSLRWSRAFQNTLGTGSLGTEATPERLPQRRQAAAKGLCQPASKRPRLTNVPVTDLTDLTDLTDTGSGSAATSSMAATVPAAAASAAAGGRALASSAAASASVSASVSASASATAAAAAAALGAAGTSAPGGSGASRPEFQMVPTILGGQFSGMPIRQMIRDYPEEAAAYLEMCQAVALSHAPEALEGSVLRPNGAAA